MNSQEIRYDRSEADSSCINVGNAIITFINSAVLRLKQRLLSIRSTYISMSRYADIVTNLGPEGRMDNVEMF